MTDPLRSYAHIEPADLNRLAQIARRDREAFFARHPRYAPLRDQIVAVALCQGAALHYVDGVTGIKDIDVWTFYGPCAAIEYPPRRPVASYDFGDAKFGRTRDFEHFAARKVDCLGRSIPARAGADPIATLREYLRNPRTTSAGRLAEKAVVLMEPRGMLGTVVWPIRPSPNH